MKPRQLRTTIPASRTAAIPLEAAGAGIRRNAGAFRPAKVRTARRRLASGRYDRRGLLDAVLERILADVTSRKE